MRSQLEYKTEEGRQREGTDSSTALIFKKKNRSKKKNQQNTNIKRATFTEARNLNGKSH